MGLRSTIEFYKEAEYLHKEIDDVYNDFEEGKIPESQKDTIINRTLDKINKLNSTLSKVDVRDLEETYNKEVIDDVEHNLDFFYEAADYIEKYLLGKRYYDSLLNGVSSLIKKLSPSPYDYKKYAENEQQLAKKFTAMLLHPHNVNQFINQIKRMALGTMSNSEFKKIFQTNKGKMTRLPSMKFESYHEYTEDYETQN